MKVYCLSYTDYSGEYPVSCRSNHVYSSREEAQKAMDWFNSIPNPYENCYSDMGIEEVEISDTFEPWLSDEEVDNLRRMAEKDEEEQEQVCQEQEFDPVPEEEMGTLTERVQNILKFFDENNQYVPGCGVFNCRNTAGDPLVNIYDKDGVSIDYCGEYDYIEVFGLSDDEYKYLYYHLG